MTVKAAFWLPAEGRLVSVETVDFLWDDRNFAGMSLSFSYQSGKHRCPSPVWVCWSETDLSVINLSGDFGLPAFMLDQIDSAVRQHGHVGPVMGFRESSMTGGDGFTVKVTRF